jgi:hypothetical protein
MSASSEDSQPVSQLYLLKTVIYGRVYGCTKRVSRNGIRGRCGPNYDQGSYWSSRAVWVCIWSNNEGVIAHNCGYKRLEPLQK